jgi:hypothetical protein
MGKKNEMQQLFMSFSHNILASHNRKAVRERTVVIPVTD